MNQELKRIKKLYGEDMMHLCRKLFPTILETEGLLLQFLTSSFEPSRFLYEDILLEGKILEFQNYIMSKLKNTAEKCTTSKTPQELLEEVGYDFHECKSEKDIQKFKKYYRSDELLCTFNDSRLASCHVFFAVKKNALELKREKFIVPQREDEYGTSVISIQFTKGNVNTLSIKNRYNHTVVNPDATFGNNLENIAEGLTDAFESMYDLNILQSCKTPFELVDYVLAGDGKFYKFNCEENNIYFCPNNIVIDNFKVKRFPREKFIVLDYFILDLENKKLYIYDNCIEDAFVDGIRNIQKITVKNISETEHKIIEILTSSMNTIIIELDKTNSIVRYVNHELTSLQDRFLWANKSLRSLDIPNVQEIGLNFLEYNIALTEIDFPHLKKAGYGFLRNNKVLKSINAPLLEEVEDHFLIRNQGLEEISLPRLRLVGDAFLYFNTQIKEVNFPLLEEVKTDFMYLNQTLISIDLPSLCKAGRSFLAKNKKIESVNFPKLKYVNTRFLESNNSLREIDLPELEEYGLNFMSYNNSIVRMSIPKVKSLCEEFLSDNTVLKCLYAPLIGEDFSEWFSARELKLDSNGIYKVRITGIKKIRKKVEDILSKINIIPKITKKLIKK